MLLKLLSALAAPLPLPLVQRAAQASLDRVFARHPELFDRLGAFASRPVTICPIDAPFEFTIVPARRTVHTSRRGRASTAGSTRISGPLVLLLSLAEGKSDGDAEFFGRHITVEGDMEAVLALRNAAESVSLDFVEDLRPRLPLIGRPTQIALDALRRKLLVQEGLPCN
jgi:predicted lipid carrier protein YhbT